MADWTLLNWAAAICMLLLAVGALGAVFRIVRGPSILDRAIATDVLLITVSSALVVLMVINDSTEYIIFVVVASVIGFVGSVTLARYTVDALPEAKRYLEDAEHTDHEQQAGRSDVTGRTATGDESVHESVPTPGTATQADGTVNTPDSHDGTMHGQEGGDRG